ncbi:MAG: serine/threonine protein kinase [Labilithrix sp.]|nr:serine/threonine protein kinase [Labilithrix sp.]MCW5810521.1 serine/threonine protein kinase [Labilithrix sp.]
MSFAPGTVIAGKYRVERLLGEGGMGIVLAARHLGLDEMVAIKLIKEDRAAGTDALARFQREARAAARIKSEHVARVLDVDRLPEGDPYIVMEYIDGTDLHALVKRRGRLPLDEASAFIVQACEGLAEAHALGMVHRDLKLKNLFLTKRRDGRALIKVIDFGVVKLAQLADEDTTRMQAAAPRDVSLTSTSTLIGSVHYMAPEQIRASNVVDPRADVWSLGVCLYAMLTLQMPFDGETVTDICMQIQGRPPRDVRAHSPHVPAELAAVVTRALEKDVRRRFGSVGELAAALAPFHADRMAASRIETILESSVQSRGALAFAATAEVPSAQGHVTQDMSIVPSFHGRVESTIDAAAVGSLAVAPAPVPAKRSYWVGAALVSLAAAGTLGLAWMRQPKARPEPAVAAAQPPATAPATKTAPATVSVEPEPAPPPSPPPPSTATPPAPARATAPKTKRPPKHEPATKTESKSEPAGAYDKF